MSSSSLSGVSRLGSFDGLSTVLQSWIWQCLWLNDIMSVSNTCRSGPTLVLTNMIRFDASGTELPMVCHLRTSFFRVILWGVGVFEWLIDSPLKYYWLPRSFRYFVLSFYVFSSPFTAFAVCFVNSMCGLKDPKKK
jgi:hypothetical protein